MSIEESKVADIYIKGIPNCIFCTKTKNLLDSNYIDYKYFNGDPNSDYVKKVMNKIKYRKFPMVFHKGKFIGGFTELKTKFNTGELHELKFDKEF